MSTPPANNGRVRMHAVSTLLICVALGCGEAEVASQAGDGSSPPPTPNDAGSSDASVSAPYMYQYEPCTTYSPVVDASVPVTLAEPMATNCRNGPGADELAAPTKGPIPSEAINPGGRGQGWDLLPDFIAVAGNEGIAGYISKFELNCCSGRTYPVVDEGLQRVIGYMVPGRGFVPLGADAGR